MTGACTVRSGRSALPCQVARLKGSCNGDVDVACWHKQLRCCCFGYIGSVVVWLSPFRRLPCMTFPPNRPWKSASLLCHALVLRTFLWERHGVTGEPESWLTHPSPRILTRHKTQFLTTSPTDAVVSPYSHGGLLALSSYDLGSGSDA